MKFEFSAGGIVYKNLKSKISNRKSEVLILLCQHSQHHGWVFPKGLIGDTHANETKEDTAVREVEEETGVLATIEKPLKPIVYWYQWEGEKRKKTVYYYIMWFVSEDVGKKDDEMEKVAWLPINEVENRLTYPSDKQVWHEAKKLLK